MAHEEGKGAASPQSEDVGATVALQFRLGGEQGIASLSEPLVATLTPSGNAGGAGSTVQLDALSSEVIAALSSVPIDLVIFTAVEGDEPETPFYADVDERIAPGTVTIQSTQQERQLSNASLPPIDSATLQALFTKKH